MNFRYATYDQLKDAIEISFKEDKEIYKYYDPNVKVECIEDIVKDILRKILEYGKCNYVIIEMNKKIIGYFVYQKNMLISFALEMKYRQKFFLQLFFNIIKDEIKNPFIVHLWKRNTRAIKWLLINDMKIISATDKIIQLCQ